MLFFMYRLALSPETPIQAYIYGGAGSPSASVSWAVSLNTPASSERPEAEWFPLNGRNNSVSKRCCFGQTTLISGKTTTVYVGGGLIDPSRPSLCLNEVFRFTTSDPTL